MATTKTISKSITKSDVINIVREVLLEEKKSSNEININTLNAKIDSNFKWLISIMIVGFMSIFFGFQQQINSIKDDNTQIKLEMKDIKSEMKDIKSEMKDIKSEMKELKSNQKVIIDTLKQIDNRIK